MLTKDVSDAQLISLTVDLHNLEQQLERLENAYVALTSWPCKMGFRQWV